MQGTSSDARLLLLSGDSPGIRGLAWGLLDPGNKGLEIGSPGRNLPPQESKQGQFLDI